MLTFKIEFLSGYFNLIIVQNEKYALCTFILFFVGKQLDDLINIFIDVIQ